MPTTAAIAGVAVSAGLGAASAAGAFSPDAPGALNYGQITRDAQQAQIDLLPQKYSTAAQYDPRFAALQSQIDYQKLFGAPASTRTVNGVETIHGWKNAMTGEIREGGEIPTDGGSGAFPQFAKTAWKPYEFQRDKTSTVKVAATPGSLGMLEQALPRINKLAADANTSSRAATITDVKNLGPAALAALKGYDPQSTSLADMLSAQALEELQAGSHLTPSEEREVQQYVRGGQASRGLGMGPTDVFTEAMSLGTAGQNRLQQRQNFAGNVINQRSQLYGDPFLAIAGTQSGRNTNPSQFSTGGGSVTLDQINPGGAPYGLAQFNANNANQANIAGYNQSMSGIGALAGTNWGSLFNNIGSLFKTSPKVPAGVPFYS